MMELTSAELLSHLCILATLTQYNVLSLTMPLNLPILVVCGERADRKQVTWDLDMLLSCGCRNNEVTLSSQHFYYYCIVKLGR